MICKTKLNTLTLAKSRTEGQQPSRCTTLHMRDPAVRDKSKHSQQTNGYAAGEIRTRNLRQRVGLCCRRDSNPQSQAAGGAMLPEGFEPAVSGSGWPPTHALDRAVTGIRPCDPTGNQKPHSNLSDDIHKGRSLWHWVSTCYIYFVSNNNNITKYCCADKKPKFLLNIFVKTFLTTYFETTAEWSNIARNETQPKQPTAADGSVTCIQMSSTTDLAPSTRNVINKSELRVSKSGQSSQHRPLLKLAFHRDLNTGKYVGCAKWTQYIENSQSYVNMMQNANRQLSQTDNVYNTLSELLSETE